MLIANMRTPAGLVNGALGTFVAVLLLDSGEGAFSKEMTDGVSVSNVEYAVVEFPKYTGQ